MRAAAVCAAAIILASPGLSAPKPPSKVSSAGAADVKPLRLPRLEGQLEALDPLGIKAADESRQFRERFTAECRAKFVRTPEFIDSCVAEQIGSATEYLRIISYYGTPLALSIDSCRKRSTIAGTTNWTEASGCAREVARRHEMAKP